VGNSEPPPQKLSPGTSLFAQVVYSAQAWMRKSTANIKTRVVNWEVVNISCYEQVLLLCRPIGNASLNMLGISSNNTHSGSAMIIDTSKYFHLAVVWLLLVPASTFI
jgi:hypothetical protein